MFFSLKNFLWCFLGFIIVTFQLFNGTLLHLTNGFSLLIPSLPPHSVSPSSLPLSLLSPSLPPRSISPSSFRLSLLVFRGSVKSQIPPVASLDRVLTAHLSSPRHSSHLPHTPRSSKRRSLDKHNHTKQGINLLNSSHFAKDTKQSQNFYTHTL